MKFDGFIGGSYEASSKTLDSQRCINLYPEIDKTGKNVISLIGTPGKTVFSTCGSGPVRGMKAAYGICYVVSGNSLYGVNNGGSPSLIGTVLGTGYVGMAFSQTQLFIASGTTSYIYTFATNVLAQITDPDFPGAVDVAYVDGYFVFIPGNSQRFYITQLNDGFSIDALDFASAEGNPDLTNGLFVNDREVWLYGNESVEIWWNSGAPDFPFERISGGFIETGLAAVKSLGRINRRLYWLGRDANGSGTIYRTNGYTLEPISTPALGFAISKYSSISDAVGYTYQQREHSFYVINFPLGGETWVFDESTGFWHQRAYMNPSDGYLRRDIGNLHVFFNKFNLVSDFSNGNIYKLDYSNYTDNGDLIKRLRSSQHSYNERHKISYSKFQVEFEPGVGLATGQGSDPQAVLRISDDGGFTWSIERWTDIGRIGEYQTITRWQRLGMGRDRVFEVSVTDPVKVVMVDASIEFQEHNG